jgi:hypothetical protein
MESIEAVKMTQINALVIALSDYQEHDLAELTETVNRLRAENGEPPCLSSALSARWRELPKNGHKTIPLYTRSGAPNTFIYKLARSVSPDNVVKMMLEA